MQHNFPGNVRELQNAVERAFYTSTGVVITDVDFFTEASSIDSPHNEETQNWFKDLTEGRENFWRLFTTGISAGIFLAKE